MRETKQKDRRIFARLKARLSLAYMDLNSQHKGQAKAYDVSAGGIGLVSPQRISPFTHLDIWFNLPGDRDPFHTTGEVIWVKRFDSDRYRVGVEFDRPELIGISQVLTANSTQDNMFNPRLRQVKRSPLYRCWDVLQKILARNHN